MVQQIIVVVGELANFGVARVPRHRIVDDSNRFTVGYGGATNVRHLRPSEYSLLAEALTFGRPAMSRGSISTGVGGHLAEYLNFCNGKTAIILFAQLETGE